MGLQGAGYTGDMRMRVAAFPPQAHALADAVDEAVFFRAAFDGEVEFQVLAPALGLGDGDEVDALAPSRDEGVGDPFFGEQEMPPWLLEG